MTAARIRRRIEVWFQDVFVRLGRLPGGFRLGSAVFRLLGRGPLFGPSFYRRARKLNLGCGARPIPGWINVDVRPLPGISVVADVRSLPFRSGVVDVARASHVLEHLHTWDVQETVAEWARVVRSGGWLMISVPDFDWVVRQYRRNPLVLADGGDERTWLVRTCLYGEAFERPKPWYEHWMVYNLDSLRRILQTNAGADRVRVFDFWREEPFTLGMYDASMEAFSLNVAARKAAAASRVH